MKATRIAISFFLIFSCGTFAFGNDFSKTIKVQVEEMGRLLLSKDYNSFTKYTYPRIIQLMGGKQKFIDRISKESENMEAKGYKLSNVSFDDPSEIIVNNKELQCTIVETLEVKVPRGRLVSKSTLIAVSSDGGKSWYFIDTSDNDIKKMQQMLPNLSGKLVLAKKNKPLFYQD